MSVEVAYNISTLESGVDSLIPTEPLESMRSLSLPPVSAVIVSASGNLIAVFVSPV